MTQPGEDLHERDLPAPDSDTRDPEAPTADALEQAMPANPADVPAEENSIGLEVDEADALDQAAIVELDDEYR